MLGEKKDRKTVCFGVLLHWIASQLKIVMVRYILRLRLTSGVSFRVQASDRHGIKMCGYRENGKLIFFRGQVVLFFKEDLSVKAEVEN